MNNENWTHSSPIPPSFSDEDLSIINLSEEYTYREDAMMHHFSK